MKVLLFGDGIFSADMMWGFEQLQQDARLIFPNTVQELKEILEDAQPDVLMTLGTPSFYKQPMLEYIGQRKLSPMRYIHWDTDGISWAELEMNLINLTKPDMVFTICPDMLNMLKGQGIQSYMLPYAFNPLVHHPDTMEEPYEGSITFTGGAYPDIVYRYPEHYRNKSMDILFKPLLEHQYKIDFYGDGRIGAVIKHLFNIDVPADWFHGYCVYDQTFHIYHDSFINLVPQNHENTLTKRTFEIMGSGGFLISCDNQAIHSLFTPGRDLVTSASREETLDIVEFYRQHKTAYKEIRRNALISAQNQTYKQRAALIVKQLNSIS